MLGSHNAIKYIQIQGTSLCDGKCKICPYALSPVAQLKRTMSLAEFEFILGKLKEAQVEPYKICLYLMSDSFFDKYLTERIEITHQYFPNTLIEISSALGAGNKRFFRKLIDALKDKPHEIWISIHGINEETYSYLCNRNFYKVKRRAIDLLKEGGELCKFKFVGCGFRETYKSNYSALSNIKISFMN